MTEADICNVELVSTNDLYDALDMVIGAMGMHNAMEELGVSWELTAKGREGVAHVE